MTLPTDTQLEINSQRVVPVTTDGRLVITQLLGAISEVPDTGCVLIIRSVPIMVGGYKKVRVEAPDGTCWLALESDLVQFTSPHVAE